MSVSIKDLRYKTKEVLESLKRGVKPIITYRGKALAQIIPLKKGEQKSFKEIGFGMWKNRKEMKDVSQWLEKLRAPRYPR